MHRKPAVLLSLMTGLTAGFASMRGAAEKAAASTRDLTEIMERREASRNSRYQRSGRWFYGVAEHHGKGVSHRKNRRDLGISARQQRRFRKDMKQLPYQGDVIGSRLHGWSPAEGTKKPGGFIWIKGFSDMSPLKVLQVFERRYNSRRYAAQLLGAAS